MVDKEKKNLIDPRLLERILAEDEEAEGGSGGQAGHIEFQDFLLPATAARVEVSPEELKRSLAINKDLQEVHVIKQKALAENRKALKEGKINYRQYQQTLGAGGGGMSAYPPHPALANQVQFSGIDKEENPLVNINEAETNDENRNELDAEYRLTNKLQPAPKPTFNPQLKPR